MNYDAEINELLKSLSVPVYNTAAPKGTAAPFVLFFFVSSFDADNTKTSKTENQSLRLQLSAYANTTIDRNGIALEIIDALEYRRGTDKVKHIEYDSFNDLFEEETRIYHRAIDFIVNAKK